MSSETTEKAEEALSMPATIRSCDKECLPPCQGDVTGQIPEWLEGTLIRNGPGLFQVGPDKYQHWFDGMALLHRFEISRGGKVTYQNRFLNSTTYQANMKAQRIVVSEFGTTAHPDPCMTIFQRFKSMFIGGTFTDNDNVNVLKIGDGVYAATETSIINRIDPNTLETIGKVDLQNLLAVNTCTAHPHYASDGALINIGNAFGSKAAYCIVQFPSEGEESLKRGSVLCRIPCSRPFYPSYYHSFGLTENYVVFVEQSLVLSIPQMFLLRLRGKAYVDALQWNQQQLVRFHVVSRSTGEIVKSHLVAEPFMVFHHANAFESEDGSQIVVDLCAYKDDFIVRTVYVEELNNSGGQEPLFDNLKKIENKTIRFVLPIKPVTDEQVESGDNLVTLAGTRATAVPRKDRSILCTPDHLSEDLSAFEMPQTNYSSVNGKKYKYLYGIGTQKESKQAGVVKLDVEKRSSTLWSLPDVTPSEPVFVARPGATEEDDGVLLSSLLNEKDRNKVSLVVLDASTMKELARADFKSPGVIPGDLHGLFFKA